jgi:hypothetical protein
MVRQPTQLHKRSLLNYLENHGFEDVMQSDSELPSGCDIVIPQSQNDYDAGLRTLYEID